MSETPDATSENTRKSAPSAATELTPQEAREYVEALSPEALAVLAREVERRLASGREGDGDSASESATAGWDYQRRPWGSGWIQRDPKIRTNRDGSVRVYGYWYFHWVEGGKRRSKYIGDDDALAAWKEHNPR